MTRENKLALVIGFGLILFVGVLVSDHFSAARTLREADLSSDGGFVTVANQPALRLVDLAPPPPDAPESMPEQMVAEAPVMAQRRPEVVEFDDVFVPVRHAQQPIEHVNVVRLPDLQELAAAEAEVEAQAASGGKIVVHLVQKGETLSAISRRYFGDATHAREIAALNDLRDPRSMREGQRIRVALPDIGGSAEPASIDGFVPVRESRPAVVVTDLGASARPQPALQQARTYTIKSSDTLSEISQRMLGTSKRWRELVAMNPDVITNPDRIPAGAVIRIPADQVVDRRFRQ